MPDVFLHRRFPEATAEPPGDRGELRVLAQAERTPWQDYSVIEIGRKIYWILYASAHAQNTSIHINRVCGIVITVT